jgi:hypothetical protein
MNRAFFWINDPSLKVLNKHAFGRAIVVAHQVFLRTKCSINQPASAKQATIPSAAVIPSILTSHHFD